MALNLIGQFFIHPTLNLGLSAPFSDNRTVKIYWDDSLLKFRVYLYDNTGTELTEALSGPTINVTSAARLLSLYTKFYSYCDSTTLNRFYPDNKYGNNYSQFTGENFASRVMLVFPYGVRELVENHWSCDTHVCNILFDLTYTVITEDDGSGNGSVEVKATTNATTVRFTRDPNATFNTATPSVSGVYTFTNLAAGTYTIYAIDEYNCKASITVIIPSVEAVYATRWRMTYNDLYGRATKVDIEELDYAGSVTEVKGSGADPFVLSWAGLAETNIFTPVIASRATIRMISETDFMFLDLFTQDERKYRVKQYKDVGSGYELKWVGFVLPELYSEPYYTDTNYVVEITANDQIGNLKNLPFTDDSGNEFVSDLSFLDAICAILRKTDINLNLRESVNIFESTMDQAASDSALQQAYFDSSIYKNADCEEVLTALLTNWGARLYQAEGYWHVELIEQRTASSIAYREFEITSQYSSNGTYTAVSNIKEATENTRSVLRDKSGLITVIPSYGKLVLLINTNSTNNLLTMGTFEPADVVNGQIKGWTFDLTNGNGVSYGIETLDKPIKESTSALFIDFTNVTEERALVMQAEQFTLASINGPRLVLRFDVLFRPYYKEFYSYIDYSLKIGDNYFCSGYNNDFPSADANILIDGEYNRVYVDQQLEWKTIEIKINSSNRINNLELTGPLTLKIRVSNNPTYDYASITALRAQSTDETFVRLSLNRVKVLDGANLRIYTLNYGTKADNSPDIIRPDDYHGTTNTRYWQLDKTLEVPVEDTLLAGVLIDNIVLTIDNGAYPEKIEIEKVINSNIKQTYTLPLNHSDLDASELSELQTDSNTKRAFKSYIRLNDGSVTTLWERTYETESRALLDILLRMLQAQLTQPSFKLSGSFLTDVYPSMFNSFKEFRMDRYFIANSLSVLDKSCSIDAELIELRTGADGEPPTGDTYEFTTEFSTEFDA